METQEILAILKSCCRIRLPCDRCVNYGDPSCINYPLAVKIAESGNQEVENMRLYMARMRETEVALEEAKKEESGSG